MKYRSFAEQELQVKLTQEFIDEFPNYGKALLTYFHGDVAEARDTAEYNYIRYAKNEEEYLRHVFAYIPDLPEFVTDNYVDFKSMAIEALDKFNVFAVDDKESGVHIFSTIKDINYEGWDISSRRFQHSQTKKKSG